MIGPKTKRIYYQWDESQKKHVPVELSDDNDYYGKDKKNPPKEDEGEDGNWYDSWTYGKED